MSKKLLEKGVLTNEKSSILIFPILAMFLLGSEQSQGESFSNSMFQKEEKIPEASQIAGKVIDRAAAKIQKNTHQSEYLKTKKLLNKAVKETSAEVQKNYSIRPCGVGVKGDLSFLSIEFECKRPLNVDEARAMLIGCLGTFQKKLKKHLTPDESIDYSIYPEVNLGITLFLSDEEYAPFTEPNVCVAKVNSTGFIFRKKSKNQKVGYKETIEETLEGAEFKNQEYLKCIKVKKQSGL